MALWWVWGVRHTDLLLQSFTGIPSIFALITLLLFLIAERTTSRRNPGHLSSFRISLHTKKLRSFSSPKLKWMELLRTTQRGNGWPLIVAELLLHQEQVGLQLVPLKDDVAHLLLSETWLVRILPLFCWLIQGHRCCQMRTRLNRGKVPGLHFETWYLGVWNWIQRQEYRVFDVGFIQLHGQVLNHFGFLLQVGLHVSLPLHGAPQLGLKNILLVVQLCVHFHETLQLLLKLQMYKFYEQM